MRHNVCLYTEAEDNIQPTDRPTSHPSFPLQSTRNQKRNSPPTIILVAVAITAVCVCMRKWLNFVRCLFICCCCRQEIHLISSARHRLISDIQTESSHTGHTTERTPRNTTHTQNLPFSLCCDVITSIHSHTHTDTHTHTQSLTLFYFRRRC